MFYHSVTVLYLVYFRFFWKKIYKKLFCSAQFHLLILYLVMRDLCEWIIQTFLFLFLIFQIAFQKKKFWKYFHWKMFSSFQHNSSTIYFFGIIKYSFFIFFYLQHTIFNIQSDKYGSKRIFYSISFYFFLFCT